MDRIRQPVVEALRAIRHDPLHAAAATLTLALGVAALSALAAVAHGLSRNLIERAADVMLKEKRRLVIVPRETPMSLPELRNLVACAEAGAMMLPAMPAFYQRPTTIDDLADFIAGKILNGAGRGPAAPA